MFLERSSYIEKIGRNSSIINFKVDLQFPKLSLKSMSNNLVRILCQFLSARYYLTFGFSFFFIYSALTTASWGQSIDPYYKTPTQPPTVPSSQGQTITDIEVRFVDRNNQSVAGKTKPHIIIREFDLKPGDIYDAELAQEGLIGVNNLIHIKQGTISLEPSITDNNVVMVVTVEERNTFFFTFGLTLPPPTALQGPARPVTVIPQSNRASGLGGGIRIGWRNLGGTSKAISLGVEATTKSFGFDFDYRDFVRHDRGYAFNFFSRQGREPEFENGDPEINLPNGDDIWIGRLGGGGEYFFPIARNFQGTVGASYQLVSARDGLYSSSLQPVDELGKPLTFSADGQDTLLTINLASALDRRNSNLNPTRGYRFLLGMDQSIPIGDANILHNRLSANFSQFLPLNLFGFTEGDRTLALNIQGGTVMGDLPPYEAFSLGGANSVRGFKTGELGTGRSFVQATVEYRFPIFKFNAFKEKYTVGGNLFVDYGSDLGSGDTVRGEPAEFRDKPGSAFGYGFGLRVPTQFGTLRLELGFNDKGDNVLHFNIGERF